jgi:hypothetical protein
VRSNTTPRECQLLFITEHHALLAPPPPFCARVNPSRGGPTMTLPPAGLQHASVGVRVRVRIRVRVSVPI